MSSRLVKKHMLKKVQFIEVLEILNNAGWAYHDFGRTVDRRWDVYYVDRHDRGAVKWEELKKRFSHLKPRVRFGCLKKEYAPELETRVVMVAKARRLREIHKCIQRRKAKKLSTAAVIVAR